MLRNHEPVSEESMEWMSPNNSICQVLREIYFSTEDAGVKLKCREATAMAKSMTKKLTEYKENWEEDFWDFHPENFKKILECQQEAESRTKVWTEF